MYLESKFESNEGTPILSTSIVTFFVISSSNKYSNLKLVPVISVNIYSTIKL